MSLASEAIDVAESAYDLERPAAEWLPGLLKAGPALFDFGLGSIAMTGAGFRPDGQPTVSQIATLDGTPDLAMNLMAAVHEVGPDKIQAQLPKALNSPVIEQLTVFWKEDPEVYEIYTRHLKCKDILSIHMHDPDGHGALISMPTPDIPDLNGPLRAQLERVAVHVTTGYRLRRRLGAMPESAKYSPTELPLDAEALLDPSRFLITDAVGDATAKEASATLREAAVRVDRARGKLRREDPGEALRIWRAMVRGRWSLVDWFDSDGRRFVLAKPNAPNLGDPRGLSEREHQVVTYAARGETSKLIAYRLGLSPQRVSTLLKSGMHKLGVKTQPQLVEKLRGFANTAEPDG